MVEIVGKLLRGHFQVISPLGGGGGGDTFIAVDIDRPGPPKCVVKRFKPPYNAPHLLLNARALFNREAETLERLGRLHEQIPMLLAHFEEEEEFYLVQDFIEGRTLVGELPLGHRWSETKVIQLLKDVLSVLKFIHSQGVIHRDVKPANIIRQRKDGKLVLIDFGAVKQVRGETGTTQTRHTNPSSISIGTEGYMPPEQWMGNPYPSSDIYALGMIGIQALTGTDPTHLQRDAEGEVVWRFKASVSDKLADVLSQMVRYHFRARYQSAAEVLQALQDATQEPVALTSELGEDSAVAHSTEIPQTTWLVPPPQQLDEPAEFQAEPVPPTFSADEALAIEPATQPQADTESKTITEQVSTTESQIPVHGQPDLEIPETAYSQPEQPKPSPEIPETAYSQPEQLQSAVDISETRYSQPERPSGLEVPETKYSQPEQSQQIPIPETKYSQPECFLPGPEIPETKYSQPGQSQSTVDIPETKYSQPDRSQPSPPIPETRYSSASTPGTAPFLSRNSRKALIAGLGAAAIAVVSGIAVLSGPRIWRGSNTTQPASSPVPSPETPVATASPQRYSQLQNYLSAHDWESADRETFRVMLEVAGPISKAQGRLAQNEWAEFPCDDLREIDRLWREASADKYSFRIQKKIFEEEEKKSQNSNNLYISFYKRIGWIEPGGLNWRLDKSDFFDNPLKGSLPAKLEWQGSKVRGVGLRFTKVEQCL